jgi:hypothetical protein
MGQLMIRMTLHTKDIERAIGNFNKAKPAAISRSLNRAATSARAFMAREVSKDMKLKVGTVKERIEIRKANARSLNAELSASMKRIPLIDFGAKGPKPSRGRGRGVTARTQTRRYPHAFIATVGSGRHEGVFQRKTVKRSPRAELFGPSIGFIFGKHLPAGMKKAETELIKNLEHEISRALRMSATP